MGIDEKKHSATKEQSSLPSTFFLENSDADQILRIFEGLLEEDGYLKILFTVAAVAPQGAFNRQRYLFCNSGLECVFIGVWQ